MSVPSTSARHRKGLTLLAVATLGAGALTALGPATGGASSHREAPLTAANPMADNTDVYAFTSPDKADTTTLIGNWIPFQDPAGGPNFYPFGAAGYRYNIKVDNDGDAKPDLTYRWTFKNVDARGTKTFLYNNGPVNSFDDPTLLFKQTYTLEAIQDSGTTVLIKDGKVAPSRVGDASMPNYQALRDEAVVPIDGGGMSFAGQADDPFFLDIRVFDLLYGGDLSEVGANSLNGFNVNSLALQAPTAALTEGGDGSGIVGVWATTEQQTMTLSAGKATPTGDFVQVSRLSAPLVNEVIAPTGLKDAFNALPPEMDGSVDALVARVTDPEVPKLLESIYEVPAPAAPRDDLVAAFLTGIEGANKPPKVVPAEMMRLNTKVPVSKAPERLGVLAKDMQGFPNGRRLGDDVVDIELQALAGAITNGIVPALAEGDKVNANDLEFGTEFPYLALPHSGSGIAARGFAGDDAGAPSAEAEPSEPTTTESTTPSASSRDADDDGNGALTAGLIGGAALLALLVGGLALARRRRNQTV